MGAHGKIVSLILALMMAGAIGPGAQAFAQSSEDALEEEIGSLVEAGRLDATLAEARRGVQQFPRSPALYQMLGEVLFKKGLNDEARQVFRRAIELAPNDPQNHFDFALVGLAENQNAAAAQSLDTLLKLDPSNAQARDSSRGEIWAMRL